MNVAMRALRNARRSGPGTIVALAIGLAIYCTAIPSAQAGSGTLVIVGGALDPDNEQIFESLIEAAPGTTPRFAIIPAASGYASDSAERFRIRLESHGVPRKQIDTVKLAMVDDPETDDIDESTWSSNASNPAEIDKIRNADAIWFTGGDQLRTTSLLLHDDGVETPMLTAIRNRLASGAVIGGTSAGAAIMSSPMIGRGDPLQSLLLSPISAVQIGHDTDTGALALADGLGFLPNSIVDQHFDRRHRFGRLARALAEGGDRGRLGIGVDENTAIIVSLETGEARIVGEAGVTIIDASSAKWATAGAFAVTNLRVHYLSDGDTIDLYKRSIVPAGGKAPTKDNENFDTPAAGGAGILSPAISLRSILTRHLTDNSSTDSFEHVTFDGTGKGVRLRFVQDGETDAWLGQDRAGEDRYTVTSVRMDIEPVSVVVE